MLKVLLLMFQRKCKLVSDWLKFLGKPGDSLASTNHLFSFTTAQPACSRDPANRAFHLERL